MNDELESFRKEKALTCEGHYPSIRLRRMNKTIKQLSQNGDNIDTMKKGTETHIEGSKEVGLEHTEN
jgi:hypothetical protein